MINNDDYDFAYSLYLAEEEYINNLNLYINFINEAEEESVNKAANNNINQYIKKVCDSATKAWENFRNKVATKAQVKKLKEMSPNIMGPKAKQLTFRIDNFPNYNLSQLQQIRVKPFDYMTMKANCSGQTKYLRAYAPKLVQDNNARILKNYRNLAKPGNTTAIITNQNITKIFNFCYKDFYRYRNIIARDLEAINKSGSGVLGENYNMINIDDLELLDEKSLMNINLMGKSKDKPKKMTFTTTNGRQITDADMKGASYSKAIQIYLKCNLSIISAKMKILRRVYEDYFSILEHYNTLATSTNTTKPNIKIK